MKGLTSHDVKCTRLQANEDPEQYKLFTTDIM